MSARPTAHRCCARRAVSSLLKPCAVKELLLLERIGLIPSTFLLPPDMENGALAGLVPGRSRQHA